MVARFQIHSAPSPTITTTVWAPTHPSSRSCAYRRAKMVSASPRQVTRKRRTTERLPGEVSTRSLGSSKTPVLTSRKRPSSMTGNRGQGFALSAAAPCGPHLHSQATAVHTQHYGWRSLPGRRTGAAAVRMILAQRLTVACRRLAQTLRHPPDAHGADGDTEQQPSQPCRQWVGRHGGQQSQQAGQRAADAAGFYAQQIQ
jgi:hypothetical protein